MTPLTPSALSVAEIPVSDTSARLRAADQVAQQHSASDSIDSPVKGCPLALRHAIEVSVVDGAGAPVANVALELRKGPSQVLRHKTGALGMARFDRLEAGPYQLSLCELDSQVWQLSETLALSPQSARSEGNALWETRPVASPGQPIVHDVAQGECAVMLAHHYGHLPETVWKANSALSAKPGRSMTVLMPGDQLVIPPRQGASIEVAVKQRYLILHQLARTAFSVRLLDSEGSPFRQCQYLIRFFAVGAVLANRLGQTDSGGFLHERIQPDVTQIEVDLNTAEGDQTYRFDVGGLDPVDETSGVVERLNNLGYPCSPGNEQSIACAVGTFQWFEQIPITGKVDDDLRGRLGIAHLS